MARRLFPSIQAFCCLAGALGCGSDEGSALPVGAGGTGGSGLGGVDARSLPYAPCTPESEVGEFNIELASDYTQVSGKVFDAILPSDVPVEVAREGECRLLTPPTLLCDPACAFSTEACGEGNLCRALPAARDLGSVTVHGLVMPLQMTPNDRTKNYTNPASPRLPHPGFLPGADLHVTTGGGDYEPFELRGWGVSLLRATPEPIIVAPGMATSVSWEVPPDAGPAHVHMDLNINKHGSSEARIECDFPDTGSAQIPAALIDGLIAKGLSGFPTLTLTRRSATSETIEPGCVELLVTSAFSTEVEVPGLTSCDPDHPCPTGQACVPVMLVCE